MLPQYQKTYLTRTSTRCAPTHQLNELNFRCCFGVNIEIHFIWKQIYTLDEVLTAMNIRFVCAYVMPRGLVDMYQRFGQTCRLHLQGRKNYNQIYVNLDTRRYYHKILEATNLKWKQT